jgi:hypothetical protein
MTPPAIHRACLRVFGKMASVVAMASATTPKQTYTTRIIAYPKVGGTCFAYRVNT